MSETHSSNTSQLGSEPSSTSQGGEPQRQNSLSVNSPKWDHYNEPEPQNITGDASQFTGEPSSTDVSAAGTDCSFSCFVSGPQ
ncbi:hypothetical protein I302_104153 [Kwoniella bestiolae CBS 10118]|uniref:Uncharacterized protein n=1 Tax=Kwoniella bestiolae CBS 10118 TaxID=1296100 RepID=A0A1B9GAG1_9TREE|nr:hypothetical protein I302_02860 [Kwoniella bestiolae CBS 10118]OCF28009.1 hypothetical protein I302_02860 [Kwoniella bestiolae CBS 10118]